ncbi:MAG: bifunctional UDP-N-acetylmuramoyl-tripeptide:D-alanyl-D-alanine ligase/alanine racemase [Sphingobacteriaceae bacterium]|nr:bifunctional UDP-N-acetylmuramoyl-tripeptide:D-alanyl-D-alanine ligase/alanine racemase [Sphingobacteriaceae bacterium]
MNDTLQALQDLAAHHRSQFHIPVIGITGATENDCKRMVVSIIKDDKNICRSPKSYNSQIGVPLSVLNLNKTHQLAIFEAGISLPGEMQKLHNIIKPTLGVFTSLGQAHDEGFKSRDQKLAEKWKLFGGAERVIANKFDDPTLRFSENMAITIGSGNDSTYKLNYVPGLTSSSIELTREGKKETFKIPFIDKASLLNCATCVVTLLHLGYKSEVIQQRLDHLQSIALRLEVKNAVHNSIIINDFYNSDIDSIRIALSFLNQQHRREKKVVIVSDIEQSGRKEEELYKDLANLLKQNNIDLLIGIGTAVLKNKDLFIANALFYPDVDAFLSDEKKVKTQLHNSSILLKGAHRFNFEKISKTLQLKSHDTILEIDLNKLTHNVNHYRSLIGKQTQLMCMVKAMGYGSGSSEVAKTLQHIGVNYLAVAYADEGVELREASITLPIMVMSPERDSFEDIIKYNLEPEIYSFKLLEDFIHALDKFGIQETFPVHLKIDTGMKRLGFEAEDIDALCEKLKHSKQIKVKSIFSHLVGSDNKELDRFTQQQIELFKASADKIEKAVGYITLKHICNTCGITRFKNAHFNMVRLGIGMYGFGVNEEENALLQNVNSLRTRISQIKHVRTAETVGYNRNGIVTSDMTIATIPIGYADGFHRTLGNERHGVWINNKFCKTVGNICMDMCMVDITNVKCKEGDEVIVFESSTQVNQMAKAMNSIPYEVLTGISSRVKRVYTQE